LCQKNENKNQVDDQIQVQIEYRAEIVDPPESSELLVINLDTSDPSEYRCYEMTIFPCFILTHIDRPQTTSNDDHFKKDPCFYSLLSLDDGAAGEDDRRVPSSSRRNQDDWESGQNPGTTLTPTAHRDAKVCSGMSTQRQRQRMQPPTRSVAKQPHAHSAARRRRRRRRRQVWLWFRDAVTRRSRDRTLLVPAEYTDYEFAIQCTRPPPPPPPPAPAPARPSATPAPSKPCPARPLGSAGKRPCIREEGGGQARGQHSLKLNPRKQHACAPRAPSPP
jgi:hypothetical protein